MESCPHTHGRTLPAIEEVRVRGWKVRQAEAMEWQARAMSRRKQIKMTANIEMQCLIWHFSRGGWIRNCAGRRVGLHPQVGFQESPRVRRLASRHLLRRARHHHPAARVP